MFKGEQGLGPWDPGMASNPQGGGRPVILILSKREDGTIAGREISRVTGHQQGATHDHVWHTSANAFKIPLNS